MSKRLPWGHQSRHCQRCGKVGPRINNPKGFGYIHAYCRTADEAKEQRARLKTCAKQGSCRRFKPVHIGPGTVFSHKHMKISVTLKKYSKQ